MVPMVPRTLAEVGMEVWGGISSSFLCCGCKGDGTVRSLDVYGS